MCEKYFTEALSLAYFYNLLLSITISITNTISINGQAKIQEKTVSDFSGYRGQRRAFKL